MGLAAIRNNSRKIVSRFSSDLDPAFMTHYVMLKSEVDPSEHIIPLLKDEIEAVLEDVLPKPLLSAEVLENWIEKQWKPGTHLKNLFGEHDFNSGAKKLVEERLPEAREDEAGIFGKITSDRNRVRKLANIFPSEANQNQDHDLAFLMSARSFYGEIPKQLTLGSIIFDTNDKEYLFVPSASLRLRQNRSR